MNKSIPFPRFFKKTSGYRIIATIAIAGIASLSQIAMGATSTWSGGGGGNMNWSKNTNWVGSVVPTSGNDLIFTGTSNLGNSNNISSFTANSILFNGAAGAFTLGGQPLTTGSGGITNSSANTQTLSFNSTGITLGAAQTWNAASGAINVDTRVQLNGNALTLVGSNNINISEKISGTSSTASASVSVGDILGAVGNVTLGANNDFGGSTVSTIGVALFSGTLTLGNSNALGTGVFLIANTGTNGVVLATNNNNLKLGNPVIAQTDFTVTPTGNLQFTGPVYLSDFSQSTIRVILSNTNTLVFAGGINQLSGTSGLTLDAAGNGGQFTFSGSTANTYTGLTTVTGSAILQLNVTGSNGAIAGNLQIDAGSGVKLSQSNQIADTSVVTVNGLLQLNGNSETIFELDGGDTGFLRLMNGTLTVQQGTYSGTINTSGNPPGGDTITKTGTGTLTLSGNNKYAGGTILNEGAIIANSNNAFGTGTITVNNLGAGVLIGSGTNGIALQNNLDVLTSFFVAPVASGTGSLALKGLMTLDTSGTTTTFVISAINSNTLRIDGGITQSGTTAANLVYDGSGTNVNGVFRIGSSAAASTYTGITIVTNAANLQLNSNLTNVSVPGALQIDNGSSVNLLKNEQIADSATVLANGLLNLNGHTETVNALLGMGRVRLNSGTFIVSQGAFAGSINDGPTTGGSLVKTGTGTLVLTNTNGYTGSTTVNGGILQVDGSIVSPNTLINAAGALRGVGRVGGNVTSFGAVSPGNSSPGTLTIGGNYVQNASASLIIQIGGTALGQHDLLAVNGSASLDGKLQLVRLNNFVAHPGDKITFLTANGGVSGTFSSVDTGTILGATVFYEPDAALLEFTGAASFAGMQGLTPNQFAVASALDKLLNDSRAAALIAYLDNVPLSELPRDYDLISPEELTAIFDISFAYADVQVSNIEARLAQDRSEANSGVTVGNLTFQDGGTTMAGYSKDDSKKSVATTESPRKWDVFMEGSGDFVHVNGDNNAAGYNFTTGGVTIGADYRVCDHLTAGIMGGYANTGATLTQNGSVDVNSGKIGLYSTAYGNGFYLNTMAAGGYNSYDTHRLGLGGIAQGNTEGAEFDGLIGTGYELHQGNFTVGPIASAQYTYVGIDGYNETGSLVPLHINSQSQESLRTKVGFKVSSDWKLRDILVTPMLTAAWQHEFLDSRYALDSSFANGAGSTFTVNGPALGRDAVVVNAGVNVQWTPRFGTYLYYDGELGRKNYQLNSVSGGARVSF